ncbi:CPS_collapsed_G0017450.mRNA.1.CDS.1 [Saccharomyces cerevisiae]|nr:CPS_collapsed_G0017450.mRNA.1.CDS.1 [Saccharomyces cerevisiae]
MITLGIFLGYCTKYNFKEISNSLQWQVPLGLCFCVGNLYGDWNGYGSESPRYLVEKLSMKKLGSLAKSNKVHGY